YGGPLGRVGSRHTKCYSLPMSLAAPRIVLHTPKGRDSGEIIFRLTALVEAWVVGGVEFVTCVGQDCEWVHDTIDEILVGDGRNPRCILTAWQTGESVEDGVELASSFANNDGASGPVQIVVL